MSDPTLKVLQVVGVRHKAHSAKKVWGYQGVPPYGKKLIVFGVQMIFGGWFYRPSHFLRLLGQILTGTGHKNTTPGQQVTKEPLGAPSTIVGSGVGRGRSCYDVTHP